MSTQQVVAQNHDLATYTAADLVKVLTAVTDLHCASIDGDHCGGPVSQSYCRECGSAWPCTTVRTIALKLRR